MEGCVLASKKHFDCLIFDECTVHFRKEFTEFLDYKNIKYFVIPPGCTGLLQPFDVGVNKSFKIKWADNFNAFLNQIIKNNEVTKTGKIRAVNASEIINLFEKSYGKVTEEVIKNSFTVTCFTSNLNDIFSDLHFKLQDNAQMVKYFKGVLQKAYEGIDIYIDLQVDKDTLSSKVSYDFKEESDEDQDENEVKLEDEQLEHHSRDDDDLERGYDEIENDNEEPESFDNQNTDEIQSTSIRKGQMMQSLCNLVIQSDETIPIMIESKQILSPLSTNYDEYVLKNSVVCLFENQIYMLLNYNNKIHFHNFKTTNKNKVKIKSLYDQDTDNIIYSILDYYYFIYDRFPICSILGDSFFQNIEDSIEKRIEQNILFFFNYDISCKEKCIINEKLIRIEFKLKKTYKPHTDLLNLNKNHQISNKFELNIFNKFIHHTNITKLGKWIQELICFLPIQIARAEDNLFHVLTDGISVPLDDCNNVYDLKSKISLGLYEAILNTWKGKILVVSSMGKQSTGKSYTLNHLSGANFAISGARCTDGCWLTMKVTNDCLYVLLDFEGIGSIERTEQEDMLLSVFNAAISNFTLYKTEYRLDREIDNMFSRFNSGSNILKGSDKIFNGNFNILIKDVLERDIDDLKHEFLKKIEIMMNKEKDKNFIDNLYKSGFSIFPFPSIEGVEYYEELIYLKDSMESEFKTIFFKGKEFLDCIKLVLSKLCISDFTSIDKQEIEHRIIFIKNNIQYCLENGQIKNSYTELNKRENALKSLDDILSEIDVNMIIKLSNNIEFIYDDSEITFNLNLNNNLINLFNKLIPKSHINHKEWHKLFSEFIKLIVDNRISRIQKWVEINLIRWNEIYEFIEIINNIRNILNQRFNEFKSIYVICNSKCLDCYGFCTKYNNHSDKHSCESNNHNCSYKCSFCNNIYKENICKYSFGHDDDHLCNDESHICGQKCMFLDSNKCENECNKVIGHQGQHTCYLKQHKCNIKCSLFECNEPCDMSAEKDHTTHKCNRNFCIKQCIISNCKLKCLCPDHFHLNPKLSNKFIQENNLPSNIYNVLDENKKIINFDYHICGNQHNCNKQCNLNGYCKVQVELNLIDELYIGKRETFTYKRKYLSQGFKLECMKIIKPFELCHEGEHIHSLDKNIFHQCKTVCPTCENICEKEYGHIGKHKTTHGNMINCFFISNQEDLSIGKHNYIVGESAKAEMCHIFCKSLGRGHIHVLECDHPKNCTYDYKINKRRHQTCVYGPNKEVPKDEILHVEYWEHINFEDPCLESDIDEFSLCPYYCNAEEHILKKEKFYCNELIWHDKIESIDSNDGHIFNCKHEKQSNHIILCLDDSISITDYDWVITKSGVKNLINERIKSKDKFTIIQYNNTYEIIVEFEDAKKVVSHLDTLTQKKGLTLLSSAINGLLKILDKYVTNENYKLIVYIYLSDGNDKTGIEEIKMLLNRFKKFGVEVYLIAFGSGLNKLYRGGISTQSVKVDLDKKQEKIFSKKSNDIGLTRNILNNP